MTHPRRRRQPPIPSPRPAASTASISLTISISRFVNAASVTRRNSLIKLAGQPIPQRQQQLHLGTASSSRPNRAGNSPRLTPRH